MVRHNPKPWVKLPMAFLYDWRMGELSWEQKGIFAFVWALAGLVTDRDDEGQETGRVGDWRYIAWNLRLTEVETREALDLLESLGLITLDDGVVTMSDYAEYHWRHPSELPAAMRERKRQQRERQAGL